MSDLITLVYASAAAIGALDLFLFACDKGWDSCLQQINDDLRDSLARRERECRKIEERAAVHMEHLRQRRQELADAAERRAIAHRPSAMSDLQNASAIDRTLRNVICMQIVNGERITIKCLLMPETGCIAMEWEVTDRRIREPRVRFECNGALQKDDWSPSNQWGEQTPQWRCGFPYHFRFDVFDGDRVIEKGLEFRLRMPNAREWRRGSHSAESTDKAEQIRASFRAQVAETTAIYEEQRKARATIEAAEMSDEEKEEWKSRIESIAAAHHDRYS